MEKKSDKKKTLVQFLRGKARYLITLVLLLVIARLFVYSYMEGQQKNKIVYADSLDMEALEVNGTILTLRQLAFYVAYEEAQVEQQALVYDDKNTGAYWNTHVNGTYIRVAARNAAIQMAIHDEIFYQLSGKEQITLTEEECGAYEQYAAEFWSDLVENNREQRLGVTYDDILEAVRKTAYAQKMQWIYAGLHNRDYEAYNFAEGAYLELLEEQEYTIYRKVWNRVPFGNVTYAHKKL